MRRESVIRSVVIIIPRIWTAWVTAYVCTKEIIIPAAADLEPGTTVSQPRHHWAIMAPNMVSPL